MKKYILIILISLMAISCEDVVNLEDNIDKDLVMKILSPSDSLAELSWQPLDIDRLKMMATHNEDISIRNYGSDTITIYSIENKNDTGLFAYTFPDGLPIEIKPGDDIKNSGKIHLKFIASVLNTGNYYDTLIFNENEAYTLPISFYVYY
jgi:hypothetical protein